MHRGLARSLYAYTVVIITIYASYEGKLRLALVFLLARFRRVSRNLDVLRLNKGT